MSPQYIRTRINGGCYFFTVNLKDRSSRLLIDYHDTLKAAFVYAKQRYPFKIDAIVIMPNHVHCIWQLPDNDHNYAVRWSLIKSYFTRHIPGHESTNQSRINRRERDVWQRRFWEHVIQDDKDWQNHVNYIHYNPVKHGYVGCVKNWPYSSFHRFVLNGFYPKDWGVNISLPIGEFE